MGILKTIQEFIRISNTWYVTGIKNLLAHLTGVADYTPTDECPGYDTKQSDDSSNPRALEIADYLYCHCSRSSITL